MSMKEDNLVILGSNRDTTISTEPKKKWYLQGIGLIVLYEATVFGGVAILFTTLALIIKLLTLVKHG